MKKIIFAIIAVILLTILYPLITEAATTVPWIRNGTNVYLPYIGDNVGFGTTNPASKVQINTNGTGNVNFGGADPSGMFSSSTIQVNVSGGIIPSHSIFNIYSSYADASLFYLNDAGAGYIRGNFGVGTTTPRGALHVNSTAAFPFTVTNYTSGTKNASTTLLNLDSTGSLRANSYANSFNNFDYFPLNKLETPSVFSYGTSTTFDGVVKLGGRRNIWEYTEDLASSRYTAGTLTAKTGATTTWNGITLSQATTTGSFYNSLRTQYTTLGYSGFTTGKRYMFSYYVQNLSSNSSPETFIWMKGLAGTNSYAHEPKLIDGTVRRIWKVCEAVSSSTTDCMYDPTVPMGSATSTVDGDIYWMWGGVDQNSSGQNLNLYMGGFQIEETIKDRPGVGLIGDSTMAGASGGVDNTASRQVSTYAAGIMNVPWFNRATGGLTCTQLNSTWSTMITPILANSKYMVIQCGINDANQLTATSTTRSEITSMYNKAVASGTIPVLMTITPFEANGSSATTSEALRSDTNAWIKKTFPRVLDIATVIQDYNASSSLNRKPVYYGDSIHFSREGSRLLGDYVAKSYIGNPYGYPNIWDFPRPTAYQKVTTNSYTSNAAIVMDGDVYVSTSTKGIILTSPDGTCARGTISNIDVLTFTSVTCPN